ncbi:MAG: gliding motility-associated C-terminal domain-containing protein [Bacteroidota bacterium]
MKKSIILITILLAGFSNLFATHNRAGEITYQHISGRTFKIIVTTYTNTDPATTQADRCDLVVYFGDGDSAVAPRINGPSNLCITADGTSIATYTKKNIYETIHTYPGDGNYFIYMEDPNRNGGICNIPNSVDQSFYLRTELVINPWLGSNSSPTLLNPPIDEACTGECFEHNPGAYDADGDSLAYSLTTCYANGGPIFGYSFPPNMSATNIDPLKGDLLWCTPTMICQYNIAILIKEYRRSPYNNQRYYIGSVLRDMQIDVGACTNTPPEIKNINDTCIVAGTNLNFTVTATDAELNLITLNATGGPFQINPTAVFSASPSISPAAGQFNWTPNCTQVQLLPYLVTFKATDSDTETPLVDFESVFIRVIPPAPTGLAAIPSGASMILNWNTAICNDTLGDNPLLGYLMYRKDMCDSWAPSACETGVPASSGYTLIGSTVPSLTAFTDNNNGQGLINGVDYSYMVVAYYSDGSQSYASTNVCAHLVRDVPIITNVSVLSTGTNDSIWVHWIKPLGIAPNLDTIADPPPYEYRLMKASGFNPAAAAFTQVASYIQPSYYQLTDSSFISNGLNTRDSAYTFRVDFYSNALLKGSTNTASSVFLTTTPADEQVNLSWQEVVPWTNYQYDIYRESPTGSAVFVKIDSTNIPSYTDTALVNGVSYCYKIVSVGQYSDTALLRPLYNHSQVKCESPVDLIPPCQPVFAVANDCEAMQNVITWTNPNTYCSDDAAQYNLYFSPTMEGTLELIFNSNDINVTSYTHNYLFEGIPSVAGCYALTAIDSTGNESPVINKICGDNCPVYELPNVFTPNGDGRNDLFSSLPYRYVKDVDFKVYDRWGVLMFETSDRNILWDGRNKNTKRSCSDGTYFYVCVVNEIRIDGIKPRIIKGFIQLLQEKNKRSN